VVAGTAKFSSHQIDYGAYCAINPVYKYQGLEVVVKGEDISCPFSSFKGGRGELVLGLRQGKPMTGSTVGELFVENGRLIYKEVLSATFLRGIQCVFVWERSEVPSIQKFGLALLGEPSDLVYSGSNGNPLDLPRKSFKCTISVAEGTELIVSEAIDEITPLPAASNWLAFDVAGKSVSLQNKLVRVVWFGFDATGLPKIIR
jgi:hypothetical protein